MNLRVPIASLCLLACACQAPAAPSAEAFFGTPQFDAVTVSPNGDHLAALVGTDDGRRLAVIARDRSRARLLDVPGPVRDYFWATDERLLATVGESWQSPGLAAVNRDGRDYALLIPPGEDAEAAQGARVLSTLPREPGRVLIALDARLPHAPDVYRLDVFTGALEREVRNPGRMFRWVPDDSGRVRAAMGWEPRSEGIRYGLWLRPVSGNGWRRAHAFTPGGPAMVPLAFDPDGGDLLVAASVGRDTAALHRLDVETGRLGPVLYGRPDVDVTGLALGPAGVAMVRWEDQLPGKHALDESLNAREDWLDDRLPGLSHRVVSTSRDGRFSVVRAWSDRSPASHYLFDRENRELELVGRGRPWLEGRVPARVPVLVTARDGWPLQGYLTRPADETAGPAPLLVMPHGGPWSRDHWGFDAAAQFFATRGWAVLQVNFRGSTGYGRAHLEFGRGQWDGLMLDDLADGARWAIGDGVADPESICILGASFGGYAALMSAVRYPDLYRCAVSFAAVTDLAGRIEGFRAAGDERAFHEWRDMVGDPERDAARLADASPLNRAAELQAPVLLAHGRRDRRVPAAHAERLVRALVAEDRAREVLWLVDSGHDLGPPANRMQFHERVLAFINEAAGR